MSSSNIPAVESVLDTLDEPPPRGLFTRLSRVALHLSRLQDESIRGLGLPYSDFVILNTLRRYGEDGGLPVVRLGRLVMRPTGSMTLILDRLEQASLIARRPDPNDRRSVLVVLTSDGKRMSQQSSEAYDAGQSKLLEGVEPDELDEIDRSVQKLLAILERSA